MRRKARRGGGRQVELTIESLGARGDGQARHEGQPVFVPFALPGERHRLRLVEKRAAGLRAQSLELLEPSPARREPPCPHFGPCGGCSVQHLDDEAYGAWKQDLLVEALKRRGFEAPAVKPLVAVGPQTRRRASLAAQKRGRGVVLGFRGRESHEIENIETCFVLNPVLFALLDPLRAVLALALAEGESAEVTLLDSDTGLDVTLVTRKPFGLAAREALAAFAQEYDLARLSWRPSGGGEAEPLAWRRAALLRFGDFEVQPPPGGFTQPTREGERFLVEKAQEWLADCQGPVADLYSGCGTFTLSLVDKRPVHAVEGGEESLAALASAARKQNLVGRVTAERRDLAREPLDSEELSVFQAVVFDPPRAGAKELAEALAASPVERVVAVSCNPATFARDARILVDGGYRMESVVPLDQFIWTGHLELAALFVRED